MTDKSIWTIWTNGYHWDDPEGMIIYFSCREVAVQYVVDNPTLFRNCIHVELKQYVEGIKDAVSSEIVTGDGGEMPVNYPGIPDS